MSDPILGSGDYDYLERVNVTSPVRAGFLPDGGRATGPWFVQPDQDKMPQSLWGKITEVLGTTKPKGDGSLKRTLPVACPLYPWLTAVAIQSVTGLAVRNGVADSAVATRKDVDDDYECQPLVDAYMSYPAFEFMVEFAHKPYALISDDAVQKETVTYYLDNDNGMVSASTAVVPQEWVRYTDYDVLPQPTTASAQHGNMIFATNGITVGTSTAPGGFTFSGFPRIMLPDATIRFRWFAVPFDYIDANSSWLTEMIGRVNQVAWYGWPAGSLLYDGVSVSRRYPPPVPEKETWTGTTGFSLRKLCDVELMFRYTRRSPGVTTTAPTNRSWIASGHNLQPFLGNSSAARGFYYVVTKADTAPFQTPLFLSVPFQLLFVDPAVYPPS